MGGRRDPCLRLYYNKLQYKAKWKGWDDDQAWYYASNFKGSPHLLKTFHETYPVLPGPPARLAEWLKAFDADEEDSEHPDDDRAQPARAPTRILKRPRHRS